MEITKIDAQTIRCTPDPVVTQPEAITYTLDQLYARRDFLEAQTAAIQRQRDAEIQDAQDQLAQVNALIDEAEKQGVKTGAEVVQEAQESAAAKLAGCEKAGIKAQVKQETQTASLIPGGESTYNDDPYEPSTTPVITQQYGTN